jgi:dienelactone hydrolase
MVLDLRSQTIESVGTRGDSDIDRVAWLNDDHLAYDISVYKRGSFILCGAKVGALHSAYPILQNVGSFLIGVPPNDRLHPLVTVVRDTQITGKYDQALTVNAGIDSGKLIDLVNLTGKTLDDAYEDNLKHISGRHPVIETPDGFLLQYMADKEGQLAFGVTSTNGVLNLHRLEGDSWQQCPEDLDEMDVYGAGDNPGEVVVLGPRKDAAPRPLEVLNAATGEVKEVLVQDKAYDGAAWLYRDPVSHDIVGAIYERVVPRVVWFSEVYRNLQKAVDAMFPGQVVRIIGNDEKGKMVLISTFSDRQPAIYRWVDLEKRTAGDIRQSRPWIDAKRMQPMNPIKYKTRDGKQLDAYVIMPAGATKENPPPLVVLPPEGNWSRHSVGFNEEAQFLASRGYAVLLPNHRGSAGTTWMFPTEDEWAYRKMHEDITEATKTLVASGLVDPKRVGIIGAGFGGFLALSGAAYEPSLYKCAVAISAVADWGKFIGDYKVSKFAGAYYSRMVRKLGDPSNNPEKWDAIAPLRHANDIRAAVFIATGEYDSPMIITGSKDVASIADHNHLPTETVSFLNEGGGIRHIEHRVELFSRIEAFLAKNLAASR